MCTTPHVWLPYLEGIGVSRTDRVLVTGCILDINSNLMSDIYGNYPLISRVDPRDGTKWSRHVREILDRRDLMHPSGHQYLEPRSRHPSPCCPDPGREIAGIMIRCHPDRLQSHRICIKTTLDPRSLDTSEKWVCDKGGASLRCVTIQHL